MAKKYEGARYWAISGLGYGRGFSPAEAVDNYVRTQLRNFPAKTTVFKTRPKWEEALRSGEAKATVFRAPEGVTGFELDGAVTWTWEEDGVTKRQEATGEERVPA